MLDFVNRNYEIQLSKSQDPQPSDQFNTVGMQVNRGHSGTPLFLRYAICVKSASWHLRDDNAHGGKWCRKSWWELYWIVKTAQSINHVWQAQRRTWIGYTPFNEMWPTYVNEEYRQTAVICSLKVTCSNATIYQLVICLSPNQKKKAYPSFSAEILAATDSHGAAYYLKSSVGSLFLHKHTKHHLHIGNKSLSEKSTIFHQTLSYRLAKFVARRRCSFPSGEINAVLPIRGNSSFAQALVKWNVTISKWPNEMLFSEPCFMDTTQFWALEDETLNSYLRETHCYGWDITRALTHLIRWWKCFATRLALLGLSYSLPLKNAKLNLYPTKTESYGAILIWFLLFAFLREGFNWNLIWVLAKDQPLSASNGV